MRRSVFNVVRPLAAFCFIGCLASQVVAADVTGAARIEDLEKRLSGMQQQVNDLMHSGSRQSSESSLPLHGFADVGVGRSGKNHGGSEGSKGFSVGSLDLYLVPNFDDRTKALIEIIFEVEGDGSLLTDLERIQMGYSVNDALTAWIGRFHSPYGYWNTAYHHGQRIQTSLSRPVFIDFEDAGGILPAHSTGAWFNGSTRLGESRMTYDLYFSNAPKIAVDAPATTGSLDMKMAGGETHRPAVGFNLALRPGAISDMTVGIHGYRGKVEDTSATPNLTRLNMIGGYVGFDDDRWEVMSEYYRFRNTDVSGSSGTFGSSAWFLQAGHHFGVVTPYARFERTRLDQSDNYFLVQESGRSYRRSVLGVAYELNAKAVIKAEVNRTRQGDLGAADDNYTETRLQFAVRF